ncbi:MAG: hypothetical protein R6X03_03230 [Methyloceanibacter sp.]|jgi:hypothetical protein
MKLATYAAAAVMLSAGYAFAGGGAPVPEGSQKDPPSGRPGKVLSEAECTKAWEMAGPDGDTLSKDKATPFILNFQMVDTSSDAKISQEEWKAGCEKGWISADVATESDMQGTPAAPKAMDKKSSSESPTSGSSTE